VRRIQPPSVRLRPPGFSYILLYQTVSTLKFGEEYIKILS
jgi:hypothetical protein